nr:non-ribosomal peptide synthetase [Pseudomonas sp. MWU16-30317]
MARVARRGATVAIEQGAVRGDAPLTPIQTWFMATDIPQRGHWNQAVMLAPRARLQADLLARALRMIVDHHDALRGRLQQGQVNYDGDAHNPLWQREAMDDTALAAVADEAQRSLDLQHGTLLRAVLIELPDGEQRLLLVVHHWVIDGVSWRIVLEDLQAVYTALEDGQPARLPAKTDSFKTWAQRLQSLASEPSFIQSLGYWEGQLSKASDALPCDRPQGLQTQAHARSVRTRLDRDWTRRLLQEAPQAYRTQINDLLLTALSRVLCRWAEQPATLIRLEGHGRESLFDDVDITRTVGWFTSVYPVCLCPDIGMGESIKAIKEQLRAVPEKGIGYGLLRYLGPEPVRARLASLPQGQVVFNYLGQFDQSFDAQHGVFIPAGESSGAGQSGDTPLPARLAINGQVFAGELELNWTFSAELYDEAQIQRLADELGRELQALVAHCEAADSGGLTPSDVPLSGLDQAQLDRLPVPARDVADLYPLSPMQQGMLFHSLSEQDGGAYINQLRLDISGLDVERFRHAWQATLDAHDVLRASFLSDQAASLQLIRKRVKLPFSECDWQGHAQLPEALDTFATVDRQRGFDLQEEPLLRLTAIKTGPDNHHLIYTNHHILMDGWSNSRLLGEVLQRYAGVSVAAPSGRFRDYIQWLGRQDASADEAFWHEQLRGFDEPTRLAQAIKRPEGGEGKGQGEWQQSFDADATQRLVAFSRQHRVTVNTVVQAAWLLLLHRYSGQASVSFGATVAGRPAALPGIEEQLGLFINTLPVIAKVPAEQSAGQWLEQLQAQNLRLREHEHTPLYAVQRWAGRSGESLFDTLLVFENYPVAEALQQASPAGLKFGPVFSREQTNYPLTLAVGLGQQLKVHYSFDRASYALETVQQVAEHWRQLLESICANADAPLGELQMLTAPQLHLVQRWSGAQPIAAAPSSVLAGIAVQVRDQPDAVALICEGQQLSYRQLDERAEALVPTLVRHGAGPEVPVGLAVDRGLGLIIGVLAILKAGSAYVPLDPAYPAERLSYMMGDSGMQLLITQRHWLAHLALPPSVQGLCLDVDEHWQRALGDRAPAPVTGGNLAYIMYTSGSTGRPKGVGISHHALAEHAQMSQGFFNLTHDDRMLQFATFSFDGFVEQLYPALMCGAAVVIRGNELWDSATFYAELLANDISVVDITTAYWFMLAKDFAEHGHRDYGRLKQLHAGGEAMPPEGLVAWRQAGLAQVRLLNTYGPTEATVTVSAHDCGPYVDQTVALPAVLPIGRPLPGRSLYLLDVDAQCAPVAAAAELCIGGPLLARGYHGRPGLTAERFLPDPFGAPGARLYRSGDLARYRQSGVIDYVGRLDHQVKIRGMRIELGEIEACLLAQPSVREALVIDVAGPAGRQLAAYVVAQSAECAGPLLGTTLKAHLSVELPDYMVPTLWTVLAQLPLSPNGKLDRSALPAPQSRVQESHFSAPRTLLEIKLAHIWAQVLKVDQVGLEDNFFELGGDSITCMQVVARARDLAYLGLDLKVRDMLSKPSIGQLLGQDAPASALLPLNRKVEGRAPLFCVHGGFGTVFDYQPLARALDGLCPVVGIQSRMLVDEQWADTSLEQMALDYVERVRAHQPEGPYRLLGWSLGGTLVSLMTAQLERQGQQVAFLGLVDSFVETPTTAAGDPGWLSDLRGFWGLIAPFWTLPPLQQSGDDQMTREQVRQVFASILTSMDAEGAARADGYLALSADELASIFHAARKLRRLAERFEGCQPVVAQPTDWWTPGREGKARQLAAQLGCALAHATAIDCTHVEIPRHPLLLSTLVARLG